LKGLKPLSDMKSILFQQALNIPLSVGDVCASDAPHRNETQQATQWDFLVISVPGMAKTYRLVRAQNPVPLH
ncbi:MAG: hypothetical protein O2890_15980, partial [Cyanobacteria bacterium]|nr:hypothetical protein [Cyanobacteriota bacterium]